MPLMKHPHIHDLTIDVADDRVDSHLASGWVPVEAAPEFGALHWAALPPAPEAVFQAFNDESASDEDE